MTMQRWNLKAQWERFWLRKAWSKSRLGRKRINRQQKTNSNPNLHKQEFVVPTGQSSNFLISDLISLIEFRSISYKLKWKNKKRRNQKRFLYSGCSWNTFLPISLDSQLNRDNKDHLELIVKCIIPSLDDHIDIFFENDELDEKSYHLVQVRNATLRPSDIGVSFTMMESTINSDRGLLKLIRIVFKIICKI